MTSSHQSVCQVCRSKIGNYSDFRWGNISLLDTGDILFNNHISIFPASLHAVVEILVRSKGRSVTRNTIAEFIDKDVNDETITKYVERIRRRFLKFQPNFNQIRCLKGFGAYRWEYAPAIERGQTHYYSDFLSQRSENTLLFSLYNRPAISN